MYLHLESNCVIEYYRISSDVVYDSDLFDELCHLCRFKKVTKVIKHKLHFLDKTFIVSKIHHIFDELETFRCSCFHNPYIIWINESKILFSLKIVLKFIMSVLIVLYIFSTYLICYKTNLQSKYYILHVRLEEKKTVFWK